MNIYIKKNSIKYVILCLNTKHLYRLICHTRIFTYYNFIYTIFIYLYLYYILSSIFKIKITTTKIKNNKCKIACTYLSIY